MSLYSDSAAPRLSTGRLVWLALPASGISLLAVLLEVYLLKFSTDVLMLGPALVGTLIGAVRWLDVVNGPIIGHLSDRTERATGQHKAWILGSALPCSAVFYLLWNLPEQHLSPLGLAIWLACLLLVFQIFHTGVSVPFNALGAETTKSYQGKNRFFGLVQVFMGIGSALAILGMAIATTSASPRETIAWVSAVSAIYFLVTIYLPIPTVAAPATLKSRSIGFRSSLRHVWRNPHARALFAAQLGYHVGTTVVFIGIPYYAEYVVGRAELAGPILAVAFVASIISIPAWSSVLKRISKAQVFAIGMTLRSLSALCFIPISYTREAPLLLILAGLFGAFGGGPMIAGPSMVGDVADYDESLTGERKEGLYYSVSKALRRFSGGIAVLIFAYGLEGAAFRPNADQSDEALFLIRFLMPCVCGAVGILGAWALRAHRLDENEHGAIIGKLKRTPK